MFSTFLLLEIDVYQKLHVFSINFKMYIIILHEYIYLRLSSTFYGKNFFFFAPTAAETVVRQKQQSADQIYAFVFIYFSLQSKLINEQAMECRCLWVFHLLLIYGLNLGGASGNNVFFCVFKPTFENKFWLIENTTFRCTS